MDNEYSCKIADSLFQSLKEFIVPGLCGRTGSGRGLLMNGYVVSYRFYNLHRSLTNDLYLKSSCLRRNACGHKRRVFDPYPHARPKGGKSCSSPENIQDYGIR